MNIKKMTNYNFLYDFVDDILQNSDNSQLCSQKITQGIRELIAVKNVVLMQVSTDTLLSKDKEYNIVSVCPLRNTKLLENNSALFKLTKYSEKFDKYYNYNEDLNHEHSKAVKKYLDELNTDSCIIFPLKVGKNNVGALLLLDIISDFRIDMILEAIDDIARILALIIKSTSLFENLEFLVNKKTEEVRQSEKRFRKLFENSLEMIHIINPEGIIVDANNKELRTLGYNKDEYIGKSLEYIVSEKYRHKTKNILKKVFKGQSINLYETELTSKDGKKISTEVNAFPLFDEKNKVQFAVAVLRDITERKNTEKILLQDQRLKAMGEVCAGIGHDFNNVFQGIISRTEALIASPKDKVDLFKYLNIIKKAALSTADRVKQLITFSEKQSNPLKHKGMLLDNIITEAIDQANQIIKENKATKDTNVEVSYSQNRNIIISGENKGSLIAAFFNIIKNSIESINCNGVILIKTFIEKNIAIIQITDNGSGMSELTASKIFEPFFTTKEFGKGTGLGMSSAYASLKGIGGNIYVKSTKPGLGTIFEIQLPLCPGQYNISKKNLSSLNKNKIRQGAKILWVDDDSEIREMGKVLLEVSGYSTTTAACAKQALKILSTEQYDIVITDIGMPEVNGWELAKVITEKYPDIKIAVLSGWNYDLSCDIKGVKAIIQKPITKNKLDDYIKRLLSH